MQVSLRARHNEGTTFWEKSQTTFLLITGQERNRNEVEMVNCLIDWASDSIIVRRRNNFWEIFFDKILCKTEMKQTTLTAQRDDIFLNA